MKNWIIILFVFVVPLSIFALLQHFAGSTSANANSFQTGKGKLIKFASPMCGECKKVGETVTLVIPDYRDSIIYEEVNVSDGSEQSKKMIDAYKVSVVPTIVFIDKNGKIFEKTEGIVTEEHIRGNLDKLK